MGSGKNRRKRTEAGPAEISGRDHVPEREKLRNHPPQRLQPDGTITFLVLILQHMALIPSNSRVLDYGMNFLPEVSL